jgi:folate-binding protein YgfZ
MLPTPTASAESPLSIDLSARAKLRLSGADRVRFLNGQVSNDVRKIAPGQSIYACVMTIKGKMCADVFIHAAPDALIVDAEGELRETLAVRLERYIIADDVQLDDVTEELALWHLLDFSPNSPALPAVLTDPDLSVEAVRSNRFGRVGLDLFFDAARTEEIRARLSGLYRESAPSELETLRVAAGTPKWGADLNENTMPAEAGLEARAVDYAKGCYIGQEVVSRVKSVGHVNRVLRGLRTLDGVVRLTVGMTLHALDAPEFPGRELGRLTSVVSRRDGAGFMALGYVRRGWETPGIVLAAIAPTANDDPVAQALTAACRVEVCSLPFSP